MQDVSIYPLGDGALTISFGNVMDEGIHQSVLQLFQGLRALSFPFIIDIVPAYSSLTVYYNVLLLHTEEKTAFDAIKEKLLPLLDHKSEAIAEEGRIIAIPVCYAQPFAPDLEEIALQKGLSAEEVIHLHTSLTYRVYMIGFLPGFPYMGRVDSRIATPRKSSPRKSIAGGSVGIAGEQTGIYPLSSPGGWNIIGRTPVQLFNKEASNPVLLQPGDSVSFYSITKDEFENYQGRSA